MHPNLFKFILWSDSTMELCQCKPCHLSRSSLQVPLHLVTYLLNRLPTFPPFVTKWGNPFEYQTTTMILEVVFFNGWRSPGRSPIASCRHDPFRSAKLSASSKQSTILAKCSGSNLQLSSTVCCAADTVTSQARRPSKAAGASWTTQPARTQQNNKILIFCKESIVLNLEAGPYATKTYELSRQSHLRGMDYPIVQAGSKGNYGMKDLL